MIDIGHQHPSDNHLGLHFNPLAYKILYDSLMKRIADTFPELLPESLAMVHPHFSVAPR